jgi:hypothetical protein
MWQAATAMPMGRFGLAFGRKIKKAPDKVPLFPHVRTAQIALTTGLLSYFAP